LNICIVGNSHVAALKQSTFSLNCTTLDYYAIPGGGAPDLIVINGKVFPDYKSDKGVTYPNFEPGAWVISNIPYVEMNGLNLNSYDLILYCGVGLPALRSSNKNPLNQVLCYPFLPKNHEKTTCNKHIVSQNSYKELLFDELEYTANLCTLKLLHENFKGDIVLQHFPVPSRTLLTQKDFDYSGSSSIPKFIKWYYEQQINFVKKLIGEYDNVSYLFDVFELVDESGMTGLKFGSPSDAWHMNDLYGDEVLKRLQLYLDNFNK